MNTKTIRILRKPEVITLTGYPRATLANHIKNGTFPPPISLGDRAVGWVSSEVDTTLSAMIAGYKKAQIQELIIELIASRAKLEVIV